MSCKCEVQDGEIKKRRKGEEVEVGEREQILEGFRHGYWCLFKMAESNHDRVLRYHIRSKLTHLPAIIEDNQSLCHLIIIFSLDGNS